MNISNAHNVSMSLHVPDIACNSDGVPEFFCPLHPAEIIAVRDEFISALFKFFRETPPQAGSPSEAIWIALPQLISDLTGAYQRSALERRFAEAGIEFSPSAHSSGALPPTSRYLQRLLKEPGRSSLLRRATRQIRALTARNKPFSLISPREASKPDAVVTFHLSPLLQAYAKVTDCNVRVSRAEDWLSAAPEGQRGLTSETSQTLKQSFRAAFAAGHEHFGDITETLLLQSADLATGWSTHQMRTLRSKRSLPKNFLSASLGIIANRAMCWAIRERGGVVTGFDHGMSTGMWDTSVQTMLEFDFLDRFVTFSNGMKQGLENNYRRELSVGMKEIPEIFVIANSYKPPTTTRQVNACDNIIYLPTIYSSDVVHLLPFINDLQAVDLQARLLSHLSLQGYRVSLKPHPESPFPIPSALTSLISGDVISERFEALDLEKTVLLFDNPQTSAFRHAILSSSPIVILDFQCPPIRPEVAPLIDERCVRVSVELDANGRVQVDWNRLNDAITQAPLRKGHKLAERYLS